MRLLCSTGLPEKRRFGDFLRWRFRNEEENEEEERREEEKKEKGDEDEEEEEEMTISRA